MNLTTIFRGLLGAAVAMTALIPAATPAAALSPTKDPVVIVGGMLGSGALTQPAYWPLRARLQAHGYDVRIFTTPDYGLGPVRANAELLRDYVASVRALTGAQKVDLVTHSQGGIIARDYIKNVGGATSVDSLVMMGTPNHGTALATLANDYLGCLGGISGCSEHDPDGPFLTELNAGDDSIGDVHYTAIATKYEEVVLPYTSIHLDARDGNITNVTVQDHCPRRFVEHGNYVLDGAVFTGVLTALRHQPFAMNCWAF